MKDQNHQEISSYGCLPRGHCGGQDTTPAWTWVVSRHFFQERMEKWERRMQSCLDLQEGLDLNVILYHYISGLF